MDLTICIAGKIQLARLSKEWNNAISGIIIKASDLAILNTSSFARISEQNLCLYFLLQYVVKMQEEHGVLAEQDKKDCLWMRWRNTSRKCLTWLNMQMVLPRQHGEVKGLRPVILHRSI